MGEYVVKLPDVGEGIAEAEIVEWHVQPGETITEDQVMVEVMTDKATVELPSPVSGTVLWVGASVGDIVPVGSPLIRIDTAADGVSDATSDGQTTTKPTAPPKPSAPEQAEAPQAASAEAAPAAAAPPSEPRSGTTAAPAVRQRAAALGINLAEITGTGPEGRIGHADLDARLLRSTSVTPTATHSGDDTVDAVPVVGLRRNIAQRMQVAKTRIPHFSYVEEIDVTEVERLRAELNEQYADHRSRLTVLPFLMRAVVVAIRDFPQMNARYDDENGVVNRHRSVHLGIATQTPKGLMVPVVKDAQARDLWGCADAVHALSTSAQDNKITLEELSGSTITITSLGSLGGIMSTPIINYPAVAIVGVNKIATRPIYVGEAVVPRQVMNLSSSFDHRVVDGADAASFIQRVKTLLETPALLFMS